MPSSRKLAIVTGASGGLGAEFAKLLAADGYDLVLVARSQEALARSAAELSAAHGITATPVALDLSRNDAAKILAAQIPRCDVLVNNAAFGTNGRFDRQDEQRIEREIVLDALTLTLLTRAYLPAMVAQGNGKVLNVASTAGFLPGPFMAVYYACKAYVISLSQALAEELRGTGVTVSCFCPGATDTGFASRAEMHETLLFKMPVATAPAMAAAGYRGMQRGTLVYVPWPATNWFVELSARLTPRRLLLWFSRKAVEVDKNA
jgi:short-subunit dehydrogenase